VHDGYSLVGVLSVSPLYAASPPRARTKAPLRRTRHEDASARAARYPQPSQEVALSNQYWVCSSVQPGTAKRAGAVTPWLGRTMTCWRVRNCSVGGLERCTVAASAETHRMINRPKANTERIAIAPIDLPPFLRGPFNATRTVPASHGGGREGELGPFQRAALGAGREIARY
jgi:hypothetical protein